MESKEKGSISSWHLHDVELFWSLSSLGEGWGWGWNDGGHFVIFLGVYCVLLFEGFMGG
jgi:hypothetical protein